jgi:NAD-dependent deacetylase
MLLDKIETVKKWISESNNIVFFGGAGVSTESGIPDFRSVDGLYHIKYAYPPETILSHQFFIGHTKEFYEFYKDKMIFRGAEPNITHRKLADLEKEGKLKGIITQNIDGLHQKAGSQNVLELHGCVLRNNCMKCGKFYDESEIINSPEIPRCSCGGTIKPDVVLYEEGLDQDILTNAVKLLSQADILIIGGTSLSVYPAAGLIRYYKGNKMVLINKSVTPYDREADLLIPAGLGEVFSRL